MPETKQKHESNAVKELLNRKEQEWKTNYIQNEENNQGGEVEDLTFVEDSLEPSSNEDAEEKIENISQSRETKIKSLNGDEEAKLGAEIQDSELNSSKNDFNPEIDTDFSPHQSEIATEVVKNPADLIYRTEKWRTVRDQNLPEELMAVEIGNSPGMVDFSYDGTFNIEDFLSGDLEFGENNRRPKPRYLGFVEADGQQFFAMGTPASTQLNSGTNAKTGEEVDQYFSSLFKSQDSLSILDITQGVATLFDADPIIKDGERVVESGRDSIYDIFVSNSNAVKREEDQERWEEELGTAVPTNENYGRIKDVVQEVESVRDYQELVLDTPAKLGPTVEPEYIEADFEIDGETWFVVDHEKEEGKTLREIVSDQEKLNVKVLKDGEMEDAVVDYNSMEGEYLENHLDLFFTYQNSMFRPDVAPKEDGVIEVRNFSNSERANVGLVTQKAMLANYEGVRDAFESVGLLEENMAEKRQDWVVNGLDTVMPNDKEMKDFYQEDLIPELAYGVKESFSEDQLPCTLEKTLLYEGIGSAEGLKQHLDSFESLDDFIDYQIELDNEMNYKSELLNVEDHSEEYEIFQDWFVEEYTNQMQEYLDQPSVNEQIHQTIEEKGVEEAYRRFARD